MMKATVVDSFSKGLDSTIELAASTRIALAAAGISSGTIRLSIGLEEIGDLIARRAGDGFTKRGYCGLSSCAA